MVNLEQYNIKSSPLKERSVPVVVPHVLELIVGTRTKRVQFLQRLEIIILIREHKYMCRGKITCRSKVITSPSAVSHPRWFSS